MKKLSILLIVISAFTLGSCASKGWSCSKRYCDASENQTKKEALATNKKVNV